MASSGVDTPYTPKESILVTGETVLFRLLKSSDEQELRQFFLQIPDTERETLRHAVADPEVISRWMKNLDYESVLPLVACEASTGRIVAVCSLHRMQGVSRHIGEIRVVVGPSHRKQGLGSSLIKELITVATELGLCFLKAEIIADNRLAVKAFRQLGFEFKCILEDFFMTRNGDTRDLVLMVKPLRINMEEDFFYVF